MMLLARESLPVPDAIGRLVGMQAEARCQRALRRLADAADRLHSRADLAGALEKRAVVKATMMRATLHLVSADDYGWPVATP
ncbi:MAG: crosslink repair DNA glycosylase YcaQ family protein [Anaerolineae bacterium]